MHFLRWNIKLVKSFEEKLISNFTETWETKTYLTLFFYDVLNTPQLRTWKICAYINYECNCFIWQTIKHHANLFIMSNTWLMIIRR